MTGCFNWRKIGVFLIASSVASSSMAAEITARPRDDGSAIILIEGTIKSGDEEKFRQITLTHPEGGVFLDSEGGELLPALEIGKMIRLRGYATVVLDDTTCASACALIWLAGSPRAAQSDANIGFHASYYKTDGGLMQAGVGNALVGSYLNLIGLPERAIIFATSASPNRMNWLDLTRPSSSGIEVMNLTSSPSMASRGQSKAGRSVEPAPVISLPRTATGPIANITESQLKAQMKASTSDPAFVAAVAGRMGLGPVERKIMEDHLRKFYQDERFLDRLAKEMVSRRHEFTDPKTTGDLARQMGATVMARLQLNGLLKLDEAEIKQYFYYFDAIPRYANAEECGIIFLSEDTLQSSPLEFQVISRIGPETFTAYLALIRKAATLALTGAPPPDLTPAQLAAAQEAFGEAYLAEILKLPEAERESALDALDNSEAYDDATVCKAYHAIFSAAYRMTGKTGHWMRQNFISEIIKELKL